MTADQRPRMSERWARALAWRGRIAGLDAARALALVGMFAAHIGDGGTRGDDTDGWHWLWIVDGRSSALFAVLAGITVSLMAAKDASALAHARARVAARGVVLIFAGYGLDLLDSGIDVILTNLGLMFLLVVPVMAWRTGALAAAGAAVLVVGGIIAPSFPDALWGLPVLEKLSSYHYPAIAWTGYLLVGMAVGRTNLRSSRTVALLTGAGAMIAFVAYGSGLLAGGTRPWSEATSGAVTAAKAGPWWASISPHSNTTLELFGNTGIALLVIGVCVLAVRPSRWTFPMLAFGSMSLTMYTAHLLVISAVGFDIIWTPSNVTLATMTVALIAVATLWRLAVGTGPLESALTRVSQAAADRLVGRKDRVDAGVPTGRDGQ